eukprot:COSAG01_NODE_33880_length_557_cov_0.644105_1_plen_92_part_01
MVLQRDSNRTVVWGFADHGDIVTTEFKGTRLNTTTGEDGVWRQYLPPQPATMQPQTLEFRSASGAKDTLHDVLWGDVFLAGGQSNMAVTLNY